MSIKRQAGFQAQRIPGAEPNGHRAATGQQIPHPDRVFPLNKQFETNGFPGIARSRNQDPGAFDINDTELVSHGLGQVARNNARKNLLGQGALQTQHRDLVSPVHHLGLRVSLPQVLQMVPVLFPVAGVHDQEVFVFHESIQVSIIDDAARFVGNHRVLSKPHIEAGSVVGQNVLEKRQRLNATNDEPAHVGNIEQPGTFSRRQVFL